VPKSDKLAYDAYLANPAGHCIECHSPMEKRPADIRNNLGAGGFEIHGPWGVSISATITPTGLNVRTHPQIKTMITRGVRPAGPPLVVPGLFNVNYLKRYWSTRLISRGLHQQALAMLFSWFARRIFRANLRALAKMPGLVRMRHASSCMATSRT
jgi:hypothetical protein